MKHKNFLKIALCLFLFTNFSYGQILTETFDNDSKFVKGESFFSDGSGDYFGIYDPVGTTDNFGAGGEPNSIPSFTGNTGNFLVGEDMDGDGFLPTQTLTWQNLDITGYTDLTFSVKLGANSGFDAATDEITLAVNIDGGGYVDITKFVNPSGFNEFPTDGTTTLGLALQTISGNISGTGSSMDLRLTVASTSGGEEFAVDDIVIDGTLATGPTITFDASASSEIETNTTFNRNISVTMSNYAAPVTVDVTVNAGESTAEIGDYTLNTASLIFNSDGSQNISLDINPDADTDHETIVIDLTINTGTATLVTSKHTVTITDDEAPSVEDFSNSLATSSYSDGSFVGNYGITWTYIQSRDENGDANGAGIDGNALMLRRVADGSKVTSSAIAGGIKDFSVKLYKGFTGSGDRQVEVFINGVSYGKSEIFDDFTEHIFNINNINITGNFTIEIRNIQSGQIIIDDISWFSFNPATVTWDGSESTDWATAANWDTNEVPTAGDNVVIADVTNKPIISSTNAETNDLTINGSATVTLNNNGTLRVYGTSSGNVTYNRNLGTENWYLVSSPVSGETYDNAYVTANNLAINGTNNAIATYTTADNTWSYMQTGGGATFTTGIGYSVKRETGQGAGDISFTGTINTSDLSVGVVTGVTTSFNLLGNPFTSYVNSASFLTDNSANLVSETIWVWNQATNNYETKVTTDNFVLAPAQGFFVNASSATNLTIAESYQASTGNAFQKTSKTEIKLMMNDGSTNRFAKIYYLSNATTGFDNGYDGETFGGIQNTVDVFTHLLSNNEGKKYQLQSLPDSDYENMVVPVGVIAAAGKEITFTAEATNLPTGINIYLEDRENNTVTQLDASSNYKVTLNTALNGTGRFFLHTRSSALSTDDVALEGVPVYTVNKNTLRISGVNSTEASVKIYTILGKKVVDTSFSSKGVYEAKLPNLTTGVYIVQLTTEKGKISKKIVLE